ncbi:MAG: response regulator [Bryobacteraceae bacterium]
MFRIMVVDDDFSLLGFTARYLARLGYAVSACQTPDKAWTLWQQSAGFHAVLVDGTLPALDGENFALKLVQADAEVRVILMSGYFCPLDRLELLAPGRVFFLPKPFTPALLAKTVKQAVAVAG